MNLPLYKKHVRDMDFKSLCQELETVARASRHSSYGSPSSLKIRAIMPHRERLPILAAEFIARGELDKYCHLFARNRHKFRTIISTEADRLEQVRLAHALYSVPRRSDVEHIVAMIDRYASGSGIVNNDLRNKNLRDMHQSSRERIQRMDRAMQKLPHDLKLFRKFSPPYTISDGDIIQDKGYMGLSAKRSVVRNFPGKYMLDLLIPQGTPYLSIWHGAASNSDYVGREQEIVLGRGRRFFVEATEKKSGFTLVHARVVTPSEIKEIKLSSMGT